MGNKDLHKARTNKKDEFYTRMKDVKRELDNYTNHFKGKTIYLNCDDPKESEFFYYFMTNFHKFKLKKLIASCYKEQDFNLFDTDDIIEKAIWVEYTGDKIDGRVPSVEEIGINYFEGDGDFRSDESIELLNQADIVITNPPFSLFREFIAQLLEYDKSFIVVGHQNSITYKDFFPLLRDNMVWLGFGFPGNVGHFVNKHYENYAVATDKKEGMIRVSGVTWFTNLEISKHYKDLELTEVYDEDKYPKYDNYDAIEVSRVAEIPMDYKGKMGVPITFMNKYVPEQFEIIGMDNMLEDGPKTRFKIAGKVKYARIVIKNKKL